MAVNVLVLRGADDAKSWIAERAARSGDDLGLVQTQIALDAERKVGARIEREVEYGGHSFNSFDEPIFIGSAIAQLSGHAEAVVVDDLDSWVARLCQRFLPAEPDELEAEISSLFSVMKARMTDLYLVGHREARAGSPADHAEVHRKLIERLGTLCTEVLER